jgi:hypothetical protein
MQVLVGLERFPLAPDVLSFSSSFSSSLLSRACKKGDEGQEVTRATKSGAEKDVAQPETYVDRLLASKSEYASLSVKKKETSPAN